jgi:hypothetical protein
VSERFFGEACSVRQLWIVSDPAGPVSVAAFERSSFATSSSRRHPVQRPWWSNWLSIGSSSWLRGSTISGPLSGPQS